jgi:sialic acid synthase SpsE/mannose-6-phosphate isomerase-like protein (cupin superfamily)
MSGFLHFSNTNPLIVLDIANNHNGSLKHGKQIIDEIVSVTSEFSFTFCLKFQFRDLPNFIHSDFRERTDVGYINRFLSTRLHWEEFAELKSYAEEHGLLTACTPFDEYSVGQIKTQRYNFLKIASASFTDWPLIEAVSSWDGPIIASTAGANISDLDRVVTYFTNRKKDFALMHCVAAYPTEDEDLQLNRLAAIKSRFYTVPVGYSTHESPDNTMAASIALACGASILERHVGSSHDGNIINRYSSEKNQLANWLHSIQKGISMLGSSKPFLVENKSELNALKGLRRVAFSKAALGKGTKFSQSDLYMAIPGTEGQYFAQDFGKYSICEALEDISEGGPITSTNTKIVNNESKVFSIRESVLRFVFATGIVIPNNAVLEISHHYGIESFNNFGSSMITVVNREYCKKYIIMLPGQDHPDMYHKIKDETFFILSGEISLRLNGEVVNLSVGETASIRPMTIHGFKSGHGAIIEEVSTSHASNDSFYVDEKIHANSNRKTIVQYWL